MKHQNNFALVYLVTHKEYTSGRISESIQKLFVEKKPSRYSSFAIYFIFNNFFHFDTSELSELIPKDIYHKVRFHFLKIDSKDDGYSSRGKSEAISNLGLSAGPNALFFGAVNFMKKLPHDYFLILETDVLPLKKYWLDGLVSFSKSNSFLIAGSTYKGLNLYCAETKWEHINGVAIYHNNKLLHDLIKSVKIYLIKKIAEKRMRANNMGEKSWNSVSKPSQVQDWFKKQNNNKRRNSLIMNYDVAIYKYCKEIGPDLFSAENTKNKIMDTDIVLDLSLSVDKKTSITDIKKKFPKGLICHKK